MIKKKEKNELRNLLQEKFDMELISKVILGGPVVKKASDEQLKRLFQRFLKFILFKFTLLN